MIKFYFVNFITISFRFNLKHYTHPPHLEKKRCVHNTSQTSSNINRVWDNGATCDRSVLTDF